MYSRASEESLLRSLLTDAPSSVTGVEAVAQDELGRRPGVLLTATETAVLDERLGAVFGPPVSQLTSVNTLGVVRSRGGRPVAETRYLWREGMCDHVALTGRCPTQPDEVAVSTRAATTLETAVGRSPVDPAIARRPPCCAYGCRGTYRPLEPRGPYWWDQGFFDAGPQGSGLEERLDRVDSMLVARGAFPIRVGSKVVAATHRAMRPQDVHLDNVAALGAGAAQVMQAQVAPSTADRPTVAMRAGYAQLFETLDRDRHVVRVATGIVTLQLVVLTWFALFLVVAAVTEERVGEVALAKLRGFTPRSAASFGLLEPVLLLLLAVPLGLLLAAALGRLIVGAALGRGIGVEWSRPVLLAVMVALVGGVAAAALAARRILREPVLEQLRQGSGAQPRVRRSTAIDAVVMVLAAVGVYQLLLQDEGDGIALLTPGLLALAVALIGVRLLPLLARVGVSRTRRSAHISRFLAARQIARRPAALRLVVLCAVAVALATFAVNSWQVSADNRARWAAQQVGAAEVLRVSSGYGRRSARHRAYGRSFRCRGHGCHGALAVRCAGAHPRRRQPAASCSLGVAATVGRECSAELADRLRPPMPAPLLVADGRFAVDAVGQRLRLPIPMTVAVQVQAGDRVVSVPLGILRRGEHEYAGQVSGCSRGCRLLGLTLQRPPGRQESVSGALHISRVTARSPDGRPLQAALSEPGRWQPTRTSVLNLANPIPMTVAVSRGGLDLDFWLDPGNRSRGCGRSTHRMHSLRCSGRTTRPSPTSPTRA
jgi:hypothetical protein